MVLTAVTTLAAAPPQVTLQVVDALDLPCNFEALRPVERAEIAAAVGEAESIALLVTSTVSLDAEPLRVRGLPAGVRVETRIATPHRRKLRGNAEVTQPYLLEEVSTVSFREPGKSVYWLTLKPGPEARPGRYNLTIRLRDAAARLAYRIRPFRLRRDPGVFFGAFCGARDADITPQHMRDLHERGFDALQFFWGSVAVRVSNDAGVMKVDFSQADRWMQELQQAGMKGPVVWSLGNDASSHMENMLSQVFQIPRPEPVVRDGKKLNFSDVSHPELNRRLKELMLAIKSHAAERRWPEIVFIIYDEPTERLMEEHENRYRFIKSFWPELKIYGVTMNRIAWAKAINHMVDILVANGDFAAISALAEQSGMPFWLYGSGSSRDQAALRRSYAWTPWVHRARSVWFWAYNYRAGDPYDDFDSASADSSMSMVWPPRTPGGPLVYSVSWDGMREAVDDLAYLQTLEWMLPQARSARAVEIRNQLEAFRQSVPSGRRVRVLGGDPHDTIDESDARQFVTRGRQAVAAWIEELLASQKSLYREIRAR